MLAFKKLMLGAAMGVAAYVGSLALAVPEAKAQTECSAYNSMYDICTVYAFDTEIGAWVPVGGFFRLRKEAEVVS